VSAIEDQIDEYANQIIETIYQKFEVKVRNGMPALIEQGVATAQPLVQNAVSQYAPQLLAEMKPQLQQTVDEMMTAAMDNTTLQAMMDAKERKMGVALVVSSIVTVAATVAVLKYLEK
jgi:hypothetical protein